MKDIMHILKIFLREILATCTPKGNCLLVENIAEVLLKEYFSPGQDLQ
ncbi:MAG: hypothetical protein NC900_05405 [Candidatus Omnitrophica bacterium]|nr:hypothetical protein [Candidatus Omnitrophota bacterium]